MVDLLDVSIIIACLQGCAGPAHGGNSLVISISNFPLFADSALMGFVWSCVLAILIGSPPCQGPAPGWCAGLGMRMRPSYIDDELAVADDAGEVTVFRELEVDVALFPLGARLPGVDRLGRGDVALVGGGGDAPEVAQYAVKLVLKLIMQSYEMASAPAGARSAMVAVGVELLAAALHGTDFLPGVIRLSGGEAKGRCHQGAPAPLAALALVVEEVGVHAYDADPLRILSLSSAGR